MKLINSYIDSIFSREDDIAEGHFVHSRKRNAIYFGLFINRKASHHVNFHFGGKECSRNWSAWWL